MRSYQLTHPSFHTALKELKEEFDLCDIFIHTWDMQEPKNTTWKYPKFMKAPENFKNKIITKKDICNVYNPTKLIIEKQDIKQVKTEKKPIKDKVYTWKYIWYSFFKANELKKQYEAENNFKYDVVIKIRPDVQFFSNFFIDELKLNQKIWYCQIFKKRAASDIILFSSSENMDCVSDFYLFFDDIWSNLSGKNNYRYNRKRECSFNDYLEKLEQPTVVSKFVMPRDWRLFRSWWQLDQQTQHEKWDRELAIKAIAADKRYSYFQGVKK